MTSDNKTAVDHPAIRFLHLIEDSILIALLLVMILMAVSQIVLRNIFESGILWGDELVRVLVLWIGLIGAMIASRTNHHISIDVITRYLPDRIKPLARLLTSVFTAVVCAVMARFSLSFILLEKQDGLIAFAGIPAWICESIIPISFAVICLRYTIISLSQFCQLIRPDHQ
jgi:TRAP-type C4-dicarboxylate transport system permease small subunit